MAFEQKVPAVIVVKSLIIGFSAGDTRGWRFEENSDGRELFDISLQSFNYVLLVKSQNCLALGQFGELSDILLPIN